MGILADKAAARAEYDGQIGQERLIVAKWADARLEALPILRELNPHIHDGMGDPILGVDVTKTRGNIYVLTQCRNYQDLLELIRITFGCPQFVPWKTGLGPGYIGFKTEIPERLLPEKPVLVHVLVRLPLEHEVPRILPIPRLDVCHSCGERYSSDSLPFCPACRSTILRTVREIVAIANRIEKLLQTVPAR